MPNSLAYLMLMIWPIVVIALFARLRADQAFVWSIVGGYLLLPPVAQFGLPLFPPLNKLSIPPLSVLVVATVLNGHRIALIPRSPWARLFVVLFLLVPFGTALTNGDPVRFAGDTGGFGGFGPPLQELPALRPYDGLSMMLRQAVVLLTFALARHFLASPEALRSLAVCLVLAGLAYSLPMLIEVRLSPQLNIWIYGFFQHAFEQMIRMGGFRPIVFLEHGLWVAFFALSSVLAAIGLARAEPERRTLWRAAAAYLFVVLLLCKTLGVMVYAVAFAPVLLFLSPRAVLRVAAGVGVAVALYPLMRAYGLVPVDAIVAFFRGISDERAMSLLFRLDNEKMLLDHALERPVFGWGDWGRNLVYDPWYGRAITIADGRWIIAFGVSGWAGYLAEFGLLLLPLVMLARGTAPVAAAAVPLALIQAVNLLDLIPNATVTPVTWLVTGALLAHAEMRRAGVVEPARGADRPPAPRPRTVL